MSWAFDGPLGGSAGPMFKGPQLGFLQLQPRPKENQVWVEKNTSLGHVPATLGLALCPTWDSPFVGWTSGCPATCNANTSVELFLDKASQQGLETKKYNFTIVSISIYMYFLIVKMAATMIMDSSSGCRTSTEWKKHCLTC